MQRADSATVFRGPDSPELLAAQTMYQPAQRHQPFPGHVPGSQWAEARQPVTQPGYWAGAPPQQAYHPAGHQRKTAYVAPAEPSAHAARPRCNSTHNGAAISGVTTWSAGKCSIIARHPTRFRATRLPR